MSALARYFQLKGSRVYGYDLTPSPLTETLEKEGIPVHYADCPEYVASLGLDMKTTLVVYTPAVPLQLGELQYFIQGGVPRG